MRFHLTTVAATPEDRGKAALTDLFEEARNDRTPIMVERVVNDIDEIVRHIRFEGWQSTHAGERQVKQALQKPRPLLIPKTLVMLSVRKGDRSRADRSRRTPEQ